MNTLNPTRAEESACTRDMRHMKELENSMRRSADVEEEIELLDVHLDLHCTAAALYAALERVSRRVDTERAAREELILLLADATTDDRLGRILESLVNKLEGE
jgi:succinylglutamate desuccinylase